ncbi:nucleolar complex protein 14 [Coemansia sp. RSA 552]|nr:nucleolar complex protein 14 [Coemansia sp. RSA 552]
MARLNATRSTAKKQSALKQLRSALSTAGITKAQSKKSKKRGTRGDDPLKKRRERLQQIQQSMNPFELQVNRKKVDVVGRQPDVVNVAQARQRGVERRRKTLGREMAQRNRDGTIVDQRIGEGTKMDPEEQMLRRFTLERKQRGKRELYNLDDADSDVEGEISELTHYGRSLADMEADFDEGPAPMDTSEIPEEEVAEQHFGGFERSNRTKAEIMREVMEKSKAYKYERQQMRNEDDEARRELDDDFAGLRSLLSFTTQEERIQMADTTGDDYESRVREFGLEMRARPQDRLKTEEEKAHEEMERLERAERHRLRRMEGLPSETENDSNSDDDDDMPEYATGGRLAVGDDLGDDFAAGSDQEIDIPTAGVELGAGLEGRNSEESGSDDSGSDDNDSDGSDLSDSADDEPAEPKARQAVPRPMADTESTLPYTFAAPKDYDAWVELVGKYTLEQQLVVVQRLRTLYHVSLAWKNKEKLAALAEILTEHIAVLAEQTPPVGAKIMDGLAQHVGGLASADPEAFGESCRQRVIAMHTRVATGIAKGRVELRASDIALMRLFASVFSASDRYNSVVTPMLVAAAQHLSQFTFKSLRAVTGGVVLAGVVHEAQRLARRLVPEVLNFVYSVLSACVCDPSDAADWAGQFPLARSQREAFGLLRIGMAEPPTTSDVGPVQWAWLTDDSAVATADVKYSILSACLSLSRRFVDCYFSLPAFVELFTPLANILDKVHQRLPQFKLHHAPVKIRQQVTELREYVKAQLASASSSRAPLQMQKHKPLAIASAVPKFEASYNLDKHYDPDKDRNEVTKLRRQLAKERRGAVRELRRDGQFLAGERLREQKAKDQQYADKMKRAWSVLESEQADMKKLDRERQKEHKRKV